MAERKAVNKYYPPDWDPRKGSINQHVGQHPLRDRARKLHMGILIIRFELPYNIWCGGCNSHIGMGVRYNAEKKKVGNYYSTPIYKFRMKCHLCDNHFEIQTDPKNHDYVIVTGARRKEQRWDPKENEQVVPEDKATQKKLATDAMFKLEHGTNDKQKGKSAVMSLGQIEDRRSEWRDDYMLNKLARNSFREKKKSIQAAKDSDKKLLEKSSLDIPLLQEKEEDIKMAGLLKYRTVQSYDEKQQEKRKEIETKPLFSPLSDNSEKTLISKLDFIKNKLNSPSMGSLASNQPSSFKSVIQKSLGIRKKSPKVQRTKSQDSGICDTGIVTMKTDTCEDRLQKKGRSEQNTAPKCAHSSITCTMGHENKADAFQINAESDTETCNKIIMDGNDCEIPSDENKCDTLASIRSHGALSLVSTYTDSDSGESSSGT